MRFDLVHVGSFVPFWWNKIPRGESRRRVGLVKEYIREHVRVFLGWFFSPEKGYNLLETGYDMWVIFCF